jgi:integrase
LIGEVSGYGRTEGKRVDEVRPQVRVGNKKKEAIVLTAVQARQLKSQHPPTLQGSHDRLLIGLLLDLGLRASEVAVLTVEDLAEPGYLTVYRQKTDTTNRMELTADLLAALADYQPDMLGSGILLRGSCKNGALTNQVMSVRAIGGRVKILGRDILGLWDLSPHDLRPTWATPGLRGPPKRAIPLYYGMPAVGPICRRPVATWNGHRWLTKGFGWIIDTGDIHKRSFVSTETEYRMG